ncbi:MAG TPA: hypothetical protein VII11_04060 [Bacteroidota bacterium]
MDMFTVLLVLFAGGIIFVGSRLFKKIQFIRKMPDEETHSQRSDVQRLLKQQLDEQHQPDDEDSSEQKPPQP